MPGRIYQLKITLKGSKPPIWRRILVPRNYDFWELHIAIQEAMGWLDCHLHEFTIKKGKKSEWLRIGIPPDDPIDEDWGPEMQAGWRIPIRKHLHTRNKKIEYSYDFGDGWEHSITLEGVLDPDPDETYPKCIAGKRACPPEDVGGLYGFYEFLQVLADPSHVEHEQFQTWSGGAYDPDRFDPTAVTFDDPAERWRYAFQASYWENPY